MIITAAGVSHPGPVRTINEDAFHCDIDMGLFIVADGMGGRDVALGADRQTLRSAEPPLDTADHLVHAALERGATDNVTALGVRCQP
jgi:serine/threonine protein phosphatase PrpC